MDMWGRRYMNYTAVWQSDGYTERNWLLRLFGPFLGDQVVDGNHQIVQENVILFDAYLHSRDLSYYEKFRGKNAFLVHLSDETYEGGYAAYSCFRGVFRNYWSNVFNPHHVMTLPLGLPNSEQYTGPLKPASERPYSWSFLGGANKASRPEMLRCMKSVSPNFIFITDVPNPPQPIVPMRRSECDQVLRDSIFVPCPMGNVNLESWRIFEALEAGAIPIVERRLTLDYFAGLLGDHPLPCFRSWEEAAKFALNVANDSSQLDRLQNRCMDWWKSYPARLTTQIGNFLEKNQHQASTAPLQSRLPQFGVWKYVELMRHHSAGAVMLRVERNIQRLAGGKRWRQTQGR